MSASVPCGACQMGEHERHDGEHHGLPGVLGGHQCSCPGDCTPPLVFDLLTRAGMTADETVALTAAKWVNEAEGRISAALAVLPEECWVTRSTGISCIAAIGGTFSNGAEWTVEMCCVPCRVKAALDPSNRPVSSTPERPGNGDA